MKPRVPCVALWSAALLATAGPIAAQSGTLSTKRALIIAIGDYPVDDGYSKLHVSRDVQLMRSTLMSQGFDSTAITTVLDAAATRDGILSALERLTSAAQVGDAIVVHYSGHGHRITDDNGDELDGFDEVLVPYGAPASVRSPGYKGERHIRDEEFGARLDMLRRRVGRTGSVTVLIDACFSGSGTRGAPEEASVRGLMAPIVVAGTVARPRTGTDTGGGLFEGPTTTRGSTNDAAAPASVAPLVVISASRHDQVAREAYDELRTPVGSLSLAISRVLPRLAPGASYRDLFDRVGSAMSGMNLGEQSPQIEGTIDASVFSGQLVTQQPFIRVASNPRDSLLELAGGSLIGLAPGTRVQFHTRGTSEPSERTRVATGTIRRASELRAVVEIDTVATAPSSLVALQDSWVFVTDYAYGDLRVRASIDTPLSATVGAAIREALRPVSLVELVNSKPDVRIGPAPPASRAARIAVFNSERATPLSTPLDPALPTFAEDLRSAMRHIARAEYIRRLELASPNLRVRMELVRTVPRLAWAGNVPTCSGAPPAPVPSTPRVERLQLSPRDEYSLRLTNEGTTPAYVVVLDVQSNGRVSQVFPLPESAGSDNLLPAGKSFLIPDICYFAEEPYGPELLKLFATRERVDFAPVVSGANASTRSGASPLEQLFGDIYAGTRGAVALPVGSASTFGIPIVVVPRRTVTRSRR